MDSTGPHPIDRHVGSRVRLRRVLIGLSQERLGVQLGVTFQQIQKYEKGTNRISASRLWQIGAILGVPIAYFFDGASNLIASRAEGFADTGQNQISGIAQSTESLQLLRHFTHIADPHVRRAVVDLTRSLSTHPKPDSDGAVS